MVIISKLQQLCESASDYRVAKLSPSPPVSFTTRYRIISFFLRSATASVPFARVSCAHVRLGVCLCLHEL